jgi:spermidine dehydrogenase
MSTDHDLGMDRRITRRDFVDGIAATVAVAATAGAVTVPASSARAAEARSMDLSPESAAYPPSLRGLRGQTQAALEVAHALRDGKTFETVEDSGEVYDLVVVGAGMSGLAAAYFYKKFFERSKILVLDNLDDFGGHARRNEMIVDGHQVISPGGTVGITNFNNYSLSGRQLLADIGIDPDRFELETSYDSTQYARMGMTSSVFFDKQTFGVDKLVVGNPLGFSGFASAASPGSLSDFLEKAPLSKSVKESLLERDRTTKDYLPGLTRAEKIARLRKMSYQSYLLDVMKLDPAIVKIIYRLDGGAVNGAAGLDSYSAWMAYKRRFPGFKGMDLGDPPPKDWTGEPPKRVHLPDGNGGVARLLVRWLIPGSLLGTTMEDSVVPGVDYSTLDRPSNNVRIRLSSTVVNAKHDGDIDSAKEVSVTYVKGGKAVRVKGGTVVMACFNAIVPYLCPEMNEVQKKALHMAVRMPLVSTNVVLRNWKPHAKLGVSNIYYPSGFYAQGSLDYGSSLGPYRRSPTPESPTFVNLWAVVMSPNSGLNTRDQFRAGRARLLAMPFEELERQARDQLARALAGGGFDPSRDIAGIFVNRWGHGYANCGNDLFDPEWTREELPWVVGRKRFGLIGVANSDAGGFCLTQAAFDQAHRAVTELITDAVHPSYGDQWGERS